MSREFVGAKLSVLVAMVSVLELGGCNTAAPVRSSVDEIAVVVLPFDVQGQEQGSDVVGRAFAESLSIGLARGQGLRVLDVPAEPVAPSEATRVIEGTLVRDGRSVAASLQLFSRPERAAIWGTELDSDGGDLAELASRLAAESLRALDAVVGVGYDYIVYLAEGPQVSKSPLAAQARDALRRADYEVLAAATSGLIEQYPDEPAWHVLAAWAQLLSWNAKPSSETLVRLRERLGALERIDPASPYDDLLRGFVYRSSGEPDHARELYSRVLGRNDLTNAARAWTLRQRSFTYLQAGDAAEARIDAEEAVRLDPANSLSLVALSKALESEGQNDASINHAAEALLLEPFLWRLHQRLGLAFERANELEQASLALERACELGGTQEACANLGVVLQQDDREQDARAAASKARSLAATPWGMYNLSCYSALAGAPARALDDLQRAVELGYADSLIHTDPDLDSLRQDPRFEAILAQVAERLEFRQQLSRSVFPWQ